MYANNTGNATNGSNSSDVGNLYFIWIVVSVTIVFLLLILVGWAGFVLWKRYLRREQEVKPIREEFLNTMCSPQDVSPCTLADENSLLVNKSILPK